MRITVCWAAAALWAAAPNLQAQSPVQFSAQFALASDYVFRGVSQTMQGPAVQAEASLMAGGLFVSVWGSNLDLASSASVEVDFTAGWEREFGGSLHFDFGVANILYVDQASLNYLEIFAKADLRRTSVALFASPDYLGSGGVGVYLDITQSVPLPQSVDLVLHVGRNWFEARSRLDSYWDFKAALSRGLGPLRLELGYWNTDLKEIEAARGRVVLLASYQFR